MNNVYTTWRQRILAPVFSILFVLTLGFTANAQTYTTIANGNWNAAATWQGGAIPPNINPLPAAATVNIRHTVNFNIGGNIGNNGTIRIQPIAGTTARLNVPTGTNVENYSTGKFYILDASYVQFRFVPGNDGQPYSGNTPGAALQSGTFKNIGGYIECRNFYAEIAQDWTNESNGVRVYENGCIYTGQNFGLTGSGSIDTLLGVNLSIGWHGSGNYTLSDGKVYYQGFRVQLAGTSGSFQLGSGTAWGDIDYIMLRNHVVPFNGGGLIEASSSVNVDDPATAGTVNLNLDAYHSATFNQNGRFIGTRTNTHPNSALNYFPANCPAGGAAPIINIDLSLTKTVNNTACYNSGDTRIFTLTVNNLSTSYTATDVTVNDLLPAGFTFVSSTGDGTYVNGTGVWTVGNIFAGQTKTRTITVTVTGTVDRTNTASFGTLNQTDPNLTNNGPAAVTVPACVVATYSIQGNVFNDVGGLVADANVNGTGTNAGGTLYVSLVNSSNVVVATVAVAGDGTYTFPTATPGNYTIVLHTTAAGSNVAAVPPGWATTGEDCCDNTGNDGTANGIVAVTVAAANITNANFGIEELPNSSIITAPAQLNPGGTNSGTVPAATFGGTDPSGGIITAIRITAFPTNATSITINGILYSTIAAIQAAYPNGIPTNATGQPTVPILVDPADGNINVVIPYATIDNAGKEDPTPGSATIPFTNLPPVTNNIYNQPVNNSAGSAPIYTLTGADIDGTVSSYTITTIPTAAQGVLYLCNPACTPVTAGQVVSPADINKLQFDPAAIFTGTVTFNYTALDNSGNTSNTSTVSIPVFNNPPTAQNILTSTIINTASSSGIPPIGGSDPDGTVASYTITTIPTPASGILYLCNPACVAVTPGQIIALADVAKLQFDPAPGFVGNAVFNYTSTDNNGNTSAAANYTIPVHGGVAANYPPVSNNIIAPSMPNNYGSTAIPGLETLDIDGTISTYTIATIPTAAMGVLYLCTPGCAPVIAGQILTPAQMAQLQFDPAPGYTGNAIFTYSGTDNSTNVSNTATYTIPITNNPPIADPVTSPPITNTNGLTAIPAINGNDRDGTVTSYTITTLPAPASGLLYLCNPGCALVTTGQIISPADVAKLQFDPAPGFTGNALFNYTSTDNNGNVSAAAVYTIPVVATNYITGLPPVANNITAAPMQSTNGSTAIPSLSSTDADGTIASYRINTIPPASEGVLYLCTPACAAVTVGQVLTPAQIAQLQFDPAPGFNGNALFNYSTVDNSGNLSNTATYTIPVLGLPPVAVPIVNATLPTTAGPTPISALSGSDADGTIASYTVTSIPAAASGILFLCNPACTPVTVGQVLTPAQVAQLQFDPAAGWNSPFSGFTYTTTDNSGNISNTANYTIPLSNFSVLPLSLINFSGQRNGNNILVQWKTENEINASHFEVEYSTDGIAFMNGGSVNANNDFVNNYQFTLINFTQLLYYVRLKSVDRDGKFKYSGIVRITMNGKLKIALAVLPNPITDKLNIRISSDIAANSDLKLINNLGQVIYRQKNSVVKGDNLFTINSLNNLPNGVYTLQVLINQEVLTAKILKN